MHNKAIRKTVIERPRLSHQQNLGDIHPLLARIYSARGIVSKDELDLTLTQLPSPWLLSGMENMVNQLITALRKQQKICVVADFDADGATSCALAVKGLKLLGAGHVSYVVPNRFEYGYGLTPEIVRLVKRQDPAVIITVDNGISSLEGVLEAKGLGMKVLITDHHLPGQSLPLADAIVNPNLHDDQFPSKALAGVGVMFFVLAALRNRLREQNWFVLQHISEPNLAQLLDYVALGTIADVVVLDKTNRVLVYQGLLRIRMGAAHHGVNALIESAGRVPQSLVAADLGFAVAPRLNAAGRMDDMALGISCLLAEDVTSAKTMAMRLNELNDERREVEKQMKNEAMALISEMSILDKPHLPAGICLFNASWHQGVIGILASRIKDRLHRPVIAFAPSGQDEIKGSARSVAGVHIRDALSDIAASHPGLLERFGGHAMAAGLSLKLHDYPAFALAFDDIIKQRLADIDLEQKVLSDGELTEQDLNLALAELLQRTGVWGQGFPEPIFHGLFDVVQTRIIGQQHVKFVLRKPAGQLLIDAIAFYLELPESWLGVRQLLVAYKLDVNEYKGSRSIQLILQYVEKLA
ncbi:MAG: single-stranded-DNA-specific exonuclease RecJ [Methylococcaceae bacterium]|jgi:single-stranded-DNA-specific exonuclease